MRKIFLASCLFFSGSALAGPTVPDHPFASVIGPSPYTFGRPLLVGLRAPAVTPDAGIPAPLGEGHNTAMVVIAAGALVISAVALIHTMNQS